MGGGRVNFPYNMALMGLFVYPANKKRDDFGDIATMHIRHTLLVLPCVYLYICCDFCDLGSENKFFWCVLLRLISVADTYRTYMSMVLYTCIYVLGIPHQRMT